MKIIVAPSKTRKMRCLDEFCDWDLQVPNEHLELMKKQTKKTNKLVRTMNSRSSETIAKKMKLKGKLLDEDCKTIAYHSKQGRGFMLNYLIVNKITEIEEFKNFNIKVYCFDQKLSSEFNFVFVRNLVLKNK